MVWDLSRSVPMVFRSPGNPLINLFHLLFNSKYHFSTVCFLLNCLFELPIVLPIGLPIVPLCYCAIGAKGPGPDRLGLGGQGSWAGPAWLGGQGSWAGPAWLGGPRVQGRAGLVLHYFNTMVLLYLIHSLFWLKHSVHIHSSLAPTCTKDLK